ncbi:fibrinogen C-terminal domain-containing protein [Trichonephila clavipes]|nr:fibrinogen C-terminal domain-containing protein [Trichonephila clavipes]
MGGSTTMKTKPMSFRTEDEETDPDRREDTDTEEMIQGSCLSSPVDCEELLQCGLNQSGIYRIYPRSRMNTWGDAGFDVYCDMDTDGGGWTVR